MIHSKNKLTLGSILFIVLLNLTSCTTSKEKSRVTDEIKKSDLVGKVFSYGPSLDSITCETYKACDCCMGYFVFLDHVKFLGADLCDDETYILGTYKVEKNSLILIYGNEVVERKYGWELETDSTGTAQSTYTTRKSTRSAPVESTVLTKIVCNEKLAFRMGDKDFYFASEDPELKLPDYLSQLRSYAVLDSLGIVAK